MEESLISYYKEQLGVQIPNLNTYSPLTLAYIGDSIYDLLVKTYYVGRENMQVNKYHHLTSGVVKAHAQAELIKAIEADLTEDELGIYKRGRNAQSYTKAKNASTIDYRMATGLEALVGYLYLKGDYHRLVDLIKLGFVRTGVIEE